MNTPTLINLPPPPSDPVTPSDMGPGTPNSGTTSLSTLSTTAIKDGHQGHLPPHHSHHQHSHHHSGSDSSTTTLDAERADRISRLAGLERVATVRPGGAAVNAPQSHLAPGAGVPPPPANQGYFDNAPPHVKERSTVGSASATGSVGGRTTWASGSDVYDPTSSSAAGEVDLGDKMSEDQEMETEGDTVSSTGGFSDEGNASLVGFGEGASSTISGPVSTPGTGKTLTRQAPGGGAVGSPTAGKFRYQAQQGGSPMSGIAPSSNDAKMIDGMTYDANVVDTAARSPMPATGAETAERIMGGRSGEVESGRRGMGGTDGQGKFQLEEK